MQYYDGASSVDSGVETSSGTDSDMPEMQPATPLVRSRSDIMCRIPSPASFEAKYEFLRQRRRRSKSV